LGPFYISGTAKATNFKFGMQTASLLVTHLRWTFTPNVWLQTL